MSQPDKLPVLVEGEYLFQIDQQTLWLAIIDPDVLVSSIRACQSVQKLTDSDYQIVVKFSLGIASPKFLIDVALSDLQEPECYKMKASSISRVMGTAAGDADVVLRKESDGTCLSYSAQILLAGALGKIGETVVQATAKKALDYFFEKLEKQLSDND